jgi:hypothetical protein
LSFFQEQNLRWVGAPNSGAQKDENFPELVAVFIGKHL